MVLVTLLISFCQPLLVVELEVIVNVDTGKREQITRRTRKSFLILCPLSRKMARCTAFALPPSSRNSYLFFRCASHTPTLLLQSRTSKPGSPKLSPDSAEVSKILVRFHWKSRTLNGCGSDKRTSTVRGSTLGASWPT